MDSDTFQFWHIPVSNIWIDSVVILLLEYNIKTRRINFINPKINNLQNIFMAFNPKFNGGNLRWFTLINAPNMAIVT